MFNLIKSFEYNTFTLLLTSVVCRKLNQKVSIPFKFGFIHCTYMFRAKFENPTSVLYMYTIFIFANIMSTTSYSVVLAYYDFNFKVFCIFFPDISHHPCLLTLLKLHFPCYDCSFNQISQ